VITNIRQEVLIGDHFELEVVAPAKAVPKGGLSVAFRPSPDSQGSCLPRQGEDFLIPRFKIRLSALERLCSVNHREIGSAVDEPCQELVNRHGDLAIVEFMADADEIDDLEVRETF
jgi:hypothetical protein